MEDFEVTINAVLFHSVDNIEIFPIDVTENKYPLIIKKLKSERQKIIDYLKKLKEHGEIKSVFRPKNKQIQEQLDNLVRLKKDIKKSIDKLKTIYN